MAPPKIKGRKMKSIADARKTSKGGGGENFIKFITDEGVTARCLVEPDDWWGFTEHYDDDLGFYPCVEGDCPGHAKGDSGSYRYLVPIVNREDDSVQILKVPKSLASDMMAKYDRRKTVMDRDYYFYKEGSGKNGTKYKVDDEDKTRFNADKYTLPDMEAALVAAWERAFEGDDADDEEEETPRRRSRGPVKSGSKKAPRRSNDDDEDDGEDEKPRRRVAATGKRKPPPRKASRGGATSRTAPKRRSVRR